MLPQALSAALPALESSLSFSVADETKPSSCGQSFWLPRSVQPPSARIRAHSRLQSGLSPLSSLRRTPPYAGTSSFAFLGSATLAQNQALQASESESKSAPNPLTHRFPLRHDVGNGGNGGGYEHAIAQVHPSVQEARGRAVQVDGGRYLHLDRA